MLRPLSAAAALALFGAAAHAQTPSPEPRKDSSAIATTPPLTAPRPVDSVTAAAIRQLLELSGTRRNMEAVMKAMIANQRDGSRGVPATFWDEFEKSVKLDDLIEMLVPIYARYLTLDEIHAIAAFYATPAGQRLIAVQPQMLTESMAAGRIWGAELSRRIVEQMKAKGYMKSS